MYTFQVIPKTLSFKQPAGTSRGVYTERKVWYVLLTDTTTGKWGVGECAPLPQLSCDDFPNYPIVLQELCQETALEGEIDYDMMRDFPSMLFGIETAMLHLKAGNIRLFDTPFTRGEQHIPINGLIWMGTFDEMFARIEEKMAKGFKCIKLKIGAIDFDREIELIKHIRSRYSVDDIEIRVDANGAFSPNEALEKLDALSRLNIHSIEQPIRAGQPDEMRRLCQLSPLPIALDEELIGVNHLARKEALLDHIAPQYIILKPSLHGGIQGADEWIRLAEQRNIGYWATSALESNVGLNAIAQWCSTKAIALPQGLGTGQLFVENIEFPLALTGDRLSFVPTAATPDFNQWLSL